jgi:hypothetical protein
MWTCHVCGETLPVLEWQHRHLARHLPTETTPLPEVVKWVNAMNDPFIEVNGIDTHFDCLLAVEVPAPIEGDWDL